MNRVLAALVAALLIALGVQSLRLSHAQEQHARAALRADSTAAAADTTRLITRQVIAALGADLAAWQRRSVQMTQRADSLDHALRLERIARAALQATVRELRAQLHAPVTGDTGVRRASFAVDTTPYRGTAAVALPPAPAMGTLDLRLTLDTAALDVRFGCGKAGPDGIRPASVTVTGPAWLTIGVTRAEQSPDLCRSPALEQKGGWRVPWWLVPLAAGAGYMIAR